MARPRITYYVAMSIDGFIAAPDDDLDFLELAGGIGEDYGYAQLLGDIDGLIMGSGTLRFIEENADEWPYAGTPAWILTSTGADWPDSAPAQAFNGSATDLTAAMAKAGVTNAWLVGGGDVAGQFAKAGMLDTLIITVVPAIIGRGTRLVDVGLDSVMQYDLTRHEAWHNGVVQLEYAARDVAE